MNQPSILHKIDPTMTKSWQTLRDLSRGIAHKNLQQLFEGDTDRVKKYSLGWDQLYLDFSKNLVTDEVLHALYALAQEVELEDGITKMFAGAPINETEERSVLHTALRIPKDQVLQVGDSDVITDVHQVLDNMRNFAERLNQGKIRGFDNQAITDIVNIGIGGSDLGPVMATHALKAFAFPNRKVHFVSNVDGADISQTLESLNPATTLFIVASKTFTTIETMTNAQSAKRWFLNDGTEADIKKHFIAVSTNARGVAEFGIDLNNMFGFWNWVGGRFSLSSAVGLSIMLATSPQHFDDLLAGMHAMDRHFATTKMDQNIPILLGLIGIWYINFLGAETHAILPYDQNLQYLPSYLQQACMESNGKSVDRNGDQLTYHSDAILWGGPGTNSQHSFFQLLHQGTRLIPCDFILPVNPTHSLYEHHDLLVANALAQTEALMRGKTKQEVIRELESDHLSSEEIKRLAPFKVFEGNKPSNLLLLKELNPFNLGALIAMYEHKIFVQGYIWNIFSFDQFGVELGKALAKAIQPELKGEIQSSLHDPSTEANLRKFKAWKTY